MDTTVISMGACRFELLTREDAFVGLGRVHIDGVPVRSGRLPWRVKTVSYRGHELARLRLREVVVSDEEVRIRLQALFRPAFTKLMWDHSTDPIHEVGDWEPEPVSGEGELELVLRPATDTFGRVAFHGFAFQYVYHSDTVPLFYLYDMASWELEGDITGVTAISQSSCSPPVVTFAPDTAWTTEGLLPFVDQTGRSLANPVMTHNLPRWASHQAFDYQCTGDHTLIGVWERVELIRSVLRREPGKPELKVFDKYLFDETLVYRSPAKAILLNSAPRTWVDQQNLWTWTLQEVHDRARAEFGLREMPVRQTLHHPFWGRWSVEVGVQEKLPAAVACGIDTLFVANLLKNDVTEMPDRRFRLGNECCCHEYEPAPSLGGMPKIRELIERCAEHGIDVFMWVNPCQSSLSPLLHYWDGNGLARALGSATWFIRLPDTRSPYCGAYIPLGGDLDLTVDGARDYWTGSLMTLKAETGITGFFWDSFYNNAFMPINYAGGAPHPVWRGTLQALKALQDAGLQVMIESFGPWGDVGHGCPTSYNLENLFACYKIQLGTGYTTVPTGQEEARPAPYPVPAYYRILAYMSKPGYPLYYGDARIDTLFTAAHRQTLRDYQVNQPHMCRRFLQEGDQGVLWHDRAGTRATLWNFVTRAVALPGTVTDTTTGQPLPPAAVYRLEACHTYAITEAVLPTRLP